MDTTIGASSSSQRQIQTRQTAKRREKEEENALKKKREDERRQNAFQRLDNIIRPSDIVVNCQLGKIKLEHEEANFLCAPVKIEMGAEKAWNGNMEMVDECDMRIVKEEVDIQNDGEQEYAPIFDAYDGEPSEDSVLEQSISSLKIETCLYDEGSLESHSLEVGRLGETLAIGNSKTEILTKKVEKLQNKLAVSTQEKEDLEKQFLNKNREIQNLNLVVRQLQNWSSAESVSNGDQSQRSPQSPSSSSLCLREIGIGTIKQLYGGGRPCKRRGWW